MMNSFTTGAGGLRPSRSNNNIASACNAVRDRIAAAEARNGRAPGSVELLAVSKAKPPEAIREAYATGQRSFGESYVQEAVAKMSVLQDLAIVWHFIGPIQSNKTRSIATLRLDPQPRSPQSRMSP